MQYWRTERVGRNGNWPVIDWNSAAVSTASVMETASLTSDRHASSSSNLSMQPALSGFTLISLPNGPIMRSFKTRNAWQKPSVSPPGLLFRLRCTNLVTETPWLLGQSSPNCYEIVIVSVNASILFAIPLIRCVMPLQRMAALCVCGVDFQRQRPKNKTL